MNIYCLDNDETDIRKILIECANSNKKKNIVDVVEKCLSEIATVPEKWDENIKEYKADYYIVIYDDYVKLCKLDEGYVNIIQFNKFTGNCVDKLLDHVIENDIQTLIFLKGYISSRKERRHIIADYHSSDMFEKDFSALTTMRKAAQDIVDKISKFQEDLTINDYTKIDE